MQWQFQGLTEKKEECPVLIFLQSKLKIWKNIEHLWQML
jgi:hypothetical protein